MTTVQHFPWEEGLPTKPDVDALLKVWPPETMTQGEWHATDDEIKSHIGRCDGTRYHTVCEAWKHRLNRDHNIVIYRRKLVGYYYPSTAEIASQSHPKLAHIGRTARSQKRDLSISNPHDGSERELVDHHGRLLQMVDRESRKARMTLILPSTRTADQPKIEAPKR